ncbi:MULTISPECIES: DNA-methyltransferase [Flavobacterium]|uniref:Methyltransferase n=1 Tax=Flavobacterium hankyongi TaxID=1176532 RepID=A0ABP8ZYH5_9FLAO|nr:site-specific DNA-methyltransferase [Flavobacterium sp. N1846]
MVYIENLEREIFLVEEPYVDLFNYMDENNLEKDFIISSKKTNVSFEAITNNSLLGNGNCNDLMAFIGSNSVDLILTDPPYNLGEFMHNRNTNLVKMRENQFAYAGWDNLSQKDWEKEMREFFKESSRILKKSGSLLMFMSLIKLETIIKIASEYKFYYKTTGIWHKTNPMPRNMNIHFVNSTEAWVYFIYNDTSGTFNNDGIMHHDFIETSLTTAKEKKFGKHPTQKPLKLMSHFVKLLSNENDVILDPFMGSGTTGVASLKHKRKFIGIELSEEYFEISKNRILNE